ncbi:hypothetical protein [Sorangium sp. So ce854]|uniref:hypothetical protein n=1 Tax=Sorangium sp. So ce854 TaxID=3133322 RepID=UPI003F6373B5
MNLPEPLYERLARRAQQTLRTVEAELVDAVATSLPDESDELPVELSAICLYPADRLSEKQLAPPPGSTERVAFFYVANEKFIRTTAMRGPERAVLLHARPRRRGGMKSSVALDGPARRCGPPRLPPG